MATQEIFTPYRNCIFITASTKFPLLDHILSLSNPFQITSSQPIFILISSFLVCPRRSLYFHISFPTKLCVELIVLLDFIHRLPFVLLTLLILILFLITIKY